MAATGKATAFRAASRYSGPQRSHPAFPGGVGGRASVTIARDNSGSPGRKQPAAHGLQRLQEAFDLEEVVAEYNILRGCLHDLAEKNGLSLQGEPFHIMNRVLDQAIAATDSQQVVAAGPRRQRPRA